MHPFVKGGESMQNNPFHNNTTPGAPGTPNTNGQLYTNPFATPQPSPAQPPQPPKKKKGRLLLIIGAVLLALVMLIVLFSGGKTKTEVRATTGSNVRYETNTSYSVRDKAKTTTTGTYTLMVYMVGSDLESQGKAASADLMEMLASRVDVSNVNILIFAGGAKQWALPISRNNTNVLKVEPNGNELKLVKVVEEPGMMNMGDPATLSTFLNYGYTNYPADHYALICWNHGGGTEFGVDENFPMPEYPQYNDRLMNDEMETALAASPFGPDNKLDWVGYDACLMASVETAAVWSDYAQYMVASQESEPGCGWDYSFLSALNQTFEPTEIASVIIEDYNRFLTTNASKMDNPPVTLSCLNLEGAKELGALTESFFSKVYADLNASANLDAIKKSLSGRVCEFSKDSPSYMYDLCDLADTLSACSPNEAAAIKAAVSEIVVQNQTNLTKASGLSTFYELPCAIDQQKEEQSSQPATGRAITLPAATDLSIDASQLTVGATDATLSLNDTQKANTARAYYTVLRRFDTNGEVRYTPVLEEKAVDISDSGSISVPLNPEVFVMRSVVDEHNTEETIMSVRSLNDYDDVHTYTTVKSRVWNTRELLPHGATQGVGIRFTEQNGSITINDVSSAGGSITAYGRASVDVHDWGYMGFVYDTLTEADSPYKLWQNDEGIFNIVSMSTGDDISFDITRTDALEEDYVCQLVLVDTAGNEYASPLFDLKNQLSENAVLEEVPTDGGTMTFLVEDDHAELYRYEGTDTALTIPDKVAGKKVTTICSDAFATQPEPNDTLTSIAVPESVDTFETYAFCYCRALETVNIPKKVTVIPDDCFFRCQKLTSIELHKDITFIGNFAFGTTGLTSLDLPKKVNHIGKAFVADSPDMTSLTIDGGTEGTYFKIVDNMLLTADGKELIYGIVDRNATSLTIPSSVVYIDDYAFFGSLHEPFPYATDEDARITKLVLPDGLKVIGDFAFVGGIALESLTLPDSLVKVGDSAFASVLFQTGATLDELHIGENVTTIRHNAFNGYIVNNVTVDEANPRYAAPNGVLMNKGGDEVIDVFAKPETE